MSENHKKRWQDLIPYHETDQELLEQEHERAKTLVEHHVENINNNIDVASSEQVVLEYDYYRQLIGKELRRRMGGIASAPFIDIESPLL